MSQPCLLCHNTQTQVLENIAVEDLDRLWRQRLGESIRAEFDGASTLDCNRCSGCGLIFFTPVRAGSAAFYDRLQRAVRLYYLDEKPEHAYARSLITGDDRVLEIGAGGGAFARQVHCREYVGLELSDAAIAIARSHGTTLMQETVEDHARQHSARYDVVCAFQVLEHVADPHGFIAASVACLRPGGRVIFSVPADDSYLGLMPNAALNLPPHHITRWPRQALLRIADLFPLELAALEHEPLCEPEPGPVTRIRKGDYARVLAAQAMSHCLGRPTRMVDLSPAQRAIDFTASLIGRLIALGLTDARLLPAGHSVTCVYRKIGTLDQEGHTQ